MIINFSKQNEVKIDSFSVSEVDFPISNKTYDMRSLYAE